MKDMWNERYAHTEYAYGKEPNQFFKAFIDQHPAGRILLPAEGEGRNAVYAALHNWEVHAVDFSEEGKRKALALAAENGVEIDYEISDLAHLDLGKTHFDAIALIFAHIPLGLREKVHRKLVGHLLPGGYLVMEVYAKSQLGRDSGGPKSLELLYSSEELLNDFEGLVIEQLEETEVHLREGIYHQGDARVIRMIARKPEDA